MFNFLSNLINRPRPQIDPQSVINRSRENVSSLPVVTSRYIVEFVLNEGAADVGHESQMEMMADEIQRVMDNHDFLLDMRYDAVEFKVVSRQVLDVAPANYPEAD